MADILGLDALFAEMILGLGLALIVGNGLAWWRHARGRDPEDAPGSFRQGRAVFLVAVGVLMALWGGVSVLA